MRKKRIGAALAVIGSYLGVCGIACVSYRAFLYPAPHADVVPEDHLLETKARDGVTVHAFDYSQPSDATVLVWFHGNGENANWSTALAADLRARNMGAVFAEYRGYGVSKNSGKPTEMGLYADAEAVLDDLEKRGHAKDHIVLLGFSLGSGVAAEMAARGRCRALVLVAPFTSIPDVAKSKIPILPMSAIITDKFDTLSKAARITMPVTMIHGTDDEVVPLEQGERVAKALSAKLVKVPGGHHADMFETHYELLMDAIAQSGRP